MCQHQPPCPDALATDRLAARVVASRPEQGWSLLCNGVVLFEDAGELLLRGLAGVDRPAGTRNWVPPAGPLPLRPAS